MGRPGGSSDGARCKTAKDPAKMCAMMKAMWAVAGAVAAAQAPARLTGDWQARAGDEIRHIMVRSDSSAQFGQDLARWRVVGDSLWITLGDGVWQVRSEEQTSELQSPCNLVCRLLLCKQQHPVIHDHDQS